MLPIRILFALLLASFGSLPLLACASGLPLPAAEAGQAHLAAGVATADPLRALLAELGIGPLDPGPAPDPAKVELGRMLFFDKEISGNRDIACATCHHPTLDTGDGLPLSIGASGVGLGPERLRGAMRMLVPRNATELYNRGSPEWRTMFWDSRLLGSPTTGFIIPAEFDVDLPPGLDSILAAQAMFPVVSHAEMRGSRRDVDVFGQINELGNIPTYDLPDVWEALIRRVLAIPEYQDLFAATYPDLPQEALGWQHAANALAAFQIDAFTLLNSPWDRYLAGDDDALSPEAREGALLFYGKAGCASCHSGNLFTDQEHHNIGVPQLGPGKGRGSRYVDPGRTRETGDPADLYTFRTPPLRNVALTGPWMHNGAFVDLEQAVRHHLDPRASLLGYDLSQMPIEVISETEWRAEVVERTLATLDALVATPTMLSEAEIGYLMAFLKALSDPAAADLPRLIPERVPSGLPVADALPADTPFVHVSAAAGITATHDPAYQITGQAWGDYDGDGWLDLYLTTGKGANLLYRNNGDGTFSLSPLAGQVALADHDSAGAIFGDYDNDGWPDLYVLARGANVLFRNLEGRGFADVTAAAGVGDASSGKTASWADFDNDGHLDLYVANWACIPRCPRPVDGDRDTLYRNNGDGTFSDVTHLLGPHTRGAGFVAAWTDFDNDGDLDLYLVNDELVHPIGNRLWRNDGPGCGGWCFTEISAAAGAATRVMGMGLAVDDFDGDGWFDFYFSNVGPMVLLRNQGDGAFTNVAAAAGVALDRSAVGWGAVALDYDNDGHRDIYLALMTEESAVSPFNALFHNNGDGTFTRLGAESGAGDPGPSVGVASADYDNDGWVDLVVGNYNRGYHLFRNQALAAHRHHWLTLHLVGGGPVNRDAVGARVTVTASDGRSQVQEVRNSSGLGGGSALALYFGLGETASAQVEVRWPDGVVHAYADVQANHAYQLLYDSAVGGPSLERR